MSLKFDLIEHGYEPEYFHASEDPQAVRDEVFKIISEHLPYLCLDSIIVEKRKTGLALQPIERFYPRMVGYLLRYVIDSAKSAYYDEVIVITDRIPHKKKRKAVEKAIKLILAEMLPAGTSYRILHHASKSSLGLQVADYCNWAVFRKWERDDERSYVLVRSAINSEFDIFSSGRRYYY